MRLLRMRRRRRGSAGHEADEARRACREAGAATIFLVCAMAVVGVVTAGVTLVASVERGRDRAAAAADAAALSGAVALSAGSTLGPCRAAAAMAASDGAELVSCAATSVDVTVRVSVAMPLLARWGAGAVAVTARAGLMS